MPSGLRKLGVGRARKDDSIASTSEAGATGYSGESRSFVSQRHNRIEA